MLIGLKRGEPIPGLVTDELIYKGVTVIGAMAANYSSFERACRLIEPAGKETFRRGVPASRVPATIEHVCRRADRCHTGGDCGRQFFRK